MLNENAKQTLEPPPVHIGSPAPLVWGDTELSESPTQDERMWGMIANASALFMVGPLLILLIKSSESKFVKFNAMQMIMVQVVCMALSIALQIVVFSMVVIMPTLATMMLPFFSLIGLAMLATLCVLASKAYNGIAFRLPVLGPFAYTKTYAT